MRSLLMHLSIVGAFGLISLTSLTVLALATGHREGIDPVGMMQCAIGFLLFAFIGKVLAPMLPERGSWEADHD